MSVRRRVEKLEQARARREDRWAEHGGPAARLLATWDAVKLDCRHYSHILDAAPSEGPHAAATEKVICDRWPALVAWFDSVPHTEPHEPIGDAPAAALAEAASIRQTYAAGLGGLDDVERDAAAWALWVASFAITLTRGVGCRFEHPAYARIK